MFSALRADTSIIRKLAQRRIWNLKDFFSFFTGSYRCLNFREFRMNLDVFDSLFPEFWPKISSVLLNFVKILKNSVVILIIKILFAMAIFFKFCQKLANYFKIPTFSSKTARNKLLWSTLIKFAGKTPPNTNNTLFVDSKGGYSFFNFR